jgi:predicted metal-dependent phosphoesterase TrpH
MASDGTAGVAQVLARAEELRLDVIAITDHDRIDAAKAAQAMAIKNKLRVQVIVGEEISTLQGHVLGLFLEERVRPLRSLRRTIAEILIGEIKTVDHLFHRDQAADFFV